MRRRFPRTRGDRPPCDRLVRPHRAVPPAHAGIDPNMARIEDVRQRFPRTRGDRPGSNQFWDVTIKVPPHTRG